MLLDLDRGLLTYFAYAGIPLAALTGIYTAWLFQQAKGRSWAKDGLLPLKFMVETLIIGAAVFVPLMLRDPLVVAAGAALLAVAWMHGKQVVRKPQMEPLL